MAALRTHSASATAPIVVAALLVLLTQPAEADFLRKVSVSQVEADVQATLSYFSELSPTASHRLASIEASTWPTFQALPKNAAGRLAPPSVRYIVHGYFAREHGWLIKGLEPHGMQLTISEVHDVSILQDKAPLLVEGLLEARTADRGLAFNDVVTMVAVLEQMMFDESVTLLRAAYHLNGVALDMPINEATMHTVLQSYLLLFGKGSKADLEDIERHQSLRTWSTIFAEIEEFEHDEVLNYEFANRHLVNPFKPREYSFKAAAEIMAVLAQQYGKWQNSECRDMKSHLVELDPEGLGRVPLGLFYAQPEGSYHFSESADYLRKIGALDETSPSNPQVYLANYIQGPSNCIASSSYYSVCCISECPEILGEFERQVAAPAASPKKLLLLAGNVSHSVFPKNLHEKLHAIAARHGGEVPLHGRLFAQWMHFAFPHECPYPSVLASATALSASQWLDGRATASVEEREQHVTSATAAPASEDFDLEQRWSDHEVLPVHKQPQPAMGTGTARIIVQLVTLVVVVRSAIAAWQATKTTRNDEAKKNDDYILRMHV